MIVFSYYLLFFQFCSLFFAFNFFLFISPANLFRISHGLALLLSTFNFLFISPANLFRISHGLALLLSTFNFLFISPANLFRISHGPALLLSTFNFQLSTSCSFLQPIFFGSVTVPHSCFQLSTFNFLFISPANLFRISHGLALLLWTVDCGLRTFYTLKSFLRP
jgi:hypothetical protein